MNKDKLMELEGLLARQQSGAVGAFNSTIGKERSELLKRYFGEKYGDEVEGLSQIVDTSVRDVLESIKPELMDIFTGGDRVVEFSPRGAEDVEPAKQETDVCNYIFEQENDGFMVLYSWFTDALMLKNGYVKRFWDERKRIEIEEYADLDPQEAAVLLEELDATSDEVEVLERSGGVDEETGQIEPLGIKVRRTSTEKRYRVEACPPEEVYVTSQWNRVDFKGCPFVAHVPRMTVTDLVEMGFDESQVMELPDYNAGLETEETYTRFAQGQTNEVQGQVDRDDSMREVEVWECYIRADMNGDGIAEQLQVFTSGDGGKILKRNGKPAVEEVTDAPFEVLSPLPIPHRHFGMSVAELVTDLARIKSVLVRQMLDNTIAANNPDEVVDSERADETTYDDISVTGIGRIIRVPGGAASYAQMAPQNTTGNSLQAIEYVDSLKELRTGVTRYNQGMDPDSLNHTATGISQLMSAAQKKVLMIARIFAETGVKSLFANMHRDLRAGPVKQIATRLNGDWVNVNPRTWRHRTDVTVNVGLGTGDRDMQFQRLSLILAQQKEMIAQGLPVYDKMHHTLTKMLELSGFRDVGNYFPEPEEVRQLQAQQAQQPQQPDPATMLAQVEQQNNVMRAQIDQSKLEIERMKVDNDRLRIMMQDDRERDLKAASIEADEAARMDKSINGEALTRG